MPVPSWMLPVLFEGLSAVPTLVADGENVFKEMATGEGGIGKVRNVMAGLMTLIEHGFEAVSAVASVPQVQGPPPAPPAPPVPSATPQAPPTPVDTLAANAGSPTLDAAGNPMGAPPAA